MPVATGTHRPAKPSWHAMPVIRHMPRLYLGQTGLGLFLDLGSKRDLGVGHLALLRHQPWLTPLPGIPGLAAESQPLVSNLRIHHTANLLVRHQLHPRCPKQPARVLMQKNLQQAGTTPSLENRIHMNTQSCRASSMGRPVMPAISSAENPLLFIARAIFARSSISPS